MATITRGVWNQQSDYEPNGSESRACGSPVKLKKIKLKGNLEQPKLEEQLSLETKEAK